MANDNFGHGHVKPRPDGLKSRCGGPGICPQCSNELGQLRLMQGTNYSVSNDSQNAYGCHSFSNAELQAIGAGQPIAEPAPKTLRDEFAMAALTGLLANPNNEYSSNGALIADSYEIADDAMKIREVQS